METTTAAGVSRKATRPAGAVRIITAWPSCGAKMLVRVTPNDIAAVVEALVNRAKSGDTAAIKLLLDRVFGRIADHDTAAADGWTELEALAHRRHVA